MKKGFTILELLVTIAIIGLLSAVVLSSLNSARGKAADSAVKSNLFNMRTQAAKLHDAHGCYTQSAIACTPTTPVAVVAGPCPTAANPPATIFSIFGDQTFYNMRDAAKQAGGGFDACSATAGGGAWAVAVQLKTDLTKAWCVDSTGASKLINNGASAYTQVALTADVNGALCGT